MANMAPRISLRTIQAAPKSTRSASSNSFFPTGSSSTSASSQPQPLPASSLWFTARPSLHQTLHSLNDTLVASRSHLFRAGLLPSIDADRSTISPARNAQFASQLPHPRARRWKSTKEMATYLSNGTDLKSSQYKNLTRVLGELEGLLPYAQLADQLQPMVKDATTGALSQPPRLVIDPVLSATQGKVNQGEGTLSEQLESILTKFVQPNKISSSGISVERVAGRDRRLGAIDDLGRVFATGARKESGARVWIIPTQPNGEDSKESRLLGQILINAMPLPEYFSLPTHRTSTIVPLTLTESLGSFNVFAIVKGGGLAAQADAVAMGLARALSEWERLQVEAGKLEEETWRDVLKKAELIERDPRMVERKKTGQVKARKKFTWVKR